MKMRYSSLYWGMIVFLLLVQNIIASSSEGIIKQIVDSFDELLGIVAIGYVYLHLFFDYKLSILEKNIFIIAHLLIIVGVISYFVYGVQPFLPAIIDCLECIKFFFVMIATSMALRINNHRNVLSRLNCFFRCIVTIFFLLAIINILGVQVFTVGDYRHLVDSQMLMFGHPANLADCILLCSISLVYNSKTENNVIYILLGTFVIITTMRSKEIAAITFLWALYFLNIKYKIQSVKFFIILGLIMGIAIAYDAMTLYYVSDDDTARGAMTYCGFMIANQYIPLGTGFASFGSGMSAVFYSPLYEEYHLNLIWGLGGENTTFINDAFWPIILGQFGWFGVAIILKFFRVLLKSLYFIDCDKYAYSSVLAIIAFLIITSFGTTGIFGSMVLAFGIVYIIIYNDNINNTDGDTEFNVYHMRRLISMDRGKDAKVFIDLF